MADRTLAPQYIDNEPDTLEAMQRAAERKRRFATTLDLYLVLTVSVLIAIGLMMVWSTTFYWSDPAWALFAQQVRNAGIGAVVMIGFTILDYRVWRRLAVPLMGVLIIVLLGRIGNELFITLMQSR